MKVIFVCSPFQGKKENIERAKRYCRMLVGMGYIPIAPHIYFSQFMDDLNPEDRRKALEMNKYVLFNIKFKILNQVKLGGIKRVLNHSTSFLYRKL